MNILSHIAIIMDGNGRWAIKKKKSRNFGHKSGLSNIKSIIEFCILKNIKYLSLYVFSIDNWKRSNSEITYLFNLLDIYLKKSSKYLISKNIKIKFIGEKNNLNKKLIKNFFKVEQLTKNNNKITVNILFNYSSKKEIVNSVNCFLKHSNKKKITANDIQKYLYTSDIPDPEILIRTGSTCRLSDFLLWQVAYTEIFFVKKFWPDFRSKDLEDIILKYKKIKRNFGSVNE